MSYVFCFCTHNFCLLRLGIKIPTLIAFDTQHITLIGGNMELFKFNINELSEEDFELYRSHMSRKRRERLDGLKFPDDRKRSLCGYMLAVKALGRLSGIPESDIVISEDKNGKPFCESSDLCFSVSHSGDLAVCAVSDAPIGVDLERIRKTNMQSARRFASESELIYIFGRIPEKSDFESDDRKTLERFFEIWTKKEAFGKMNGTGICYDMKNTAVENAVCYKEDGYIITVCEKI